MTLALVLKLSREGLKGRDITANLSENGHVSGAV